MRIEFEEEGGREQRREGDPRVCIVIAFRGWLRVDCVSIGSLDERQHSIAIILLKI